MPSLRRISGSRLSLPFMIACSTLLWACRLFFDYTQWPSFVLFSLNVGLMVELNNRHALMRQYSRMVSCSYITLMLMWQSIAVDLHSMIVQSCVIIALMLIFSTYQKREDMGHKYWAYLFLGISVVLWPPALFLVPLFWIGEAAYLMSFSGRAFFASLFGLVTPWWIMLPFVYFDDFRQIIFSHLEAFIPEVSLFNVIAEDGSILIALPPIQPLEAAMASILVIMLLSGMIHYFRQSYADKIHVRMLYQFFTLIALVTLSLLIVLSALPVFSEQLWHILISILIICCSPLFGHYVTFVDNRFSRILIWIIMLISVGLIAVSTANQIPWQ